MTLSRCARLMLPPLPYRWKGLYGTSLSKAPRRRSKKNNTAISWIKQFLAVKPRRRKRYCIERWTRQDFKVLRLVYSTIKWKHTKTYSTVTSSEELDTRHHEKSRQGEESGRHQSYRRHRIATSKMHKREHSESSLRVPWQWSKDMRRTLPTVIPVSSISGDVMLMTWH